MTRVRIIGATGYAGAELVRILKGHSEVDVTCLTSRQYSGTHFDSIYPSMSGIVDLTLETFTADLMNEKADVIFTALPHQLPMEIIPDLLRNGKKVVDLSADFRFKNVSTYEAYYQHHSAKELLKEAVYGLSEVYFDEIKNARLIGNPGCYPTTVLLPLIPLLRKEIIDENSIIADSKSGVSGAGRGASLTTHFCQVTESFKAYKVAQHRHNPEMEEILSSQAEKDIKISFVPHLLPMSRGMETTLYAGLKAQISYDEVHKILFETYKDHPFVRLCPEDRFPDTLNVRGTNFCDIGFKIDQRNNRIIIMSVIDNLVKGAAGQAVQNMNIMLGFPEIQGLMNIPYPI